MSITRINSSERASQIVIHNETIYLAGQVASDVTVGIQEQTQNCLDKVEARLIEAGSDKDHILSSTVFLRDMKDFAFMNEIWNAWFADCGKPARACVAAEMARREILVEICVIAAVKG